jgi:hypothetical protein
MVNGAQVRPCYRCGVYNQLTIDEQLRAELLAMRTEDRRVREELIAAARDGREPLRSKDGGSASKSPKSPDGRPTGTQRAQYYRSGVKPGFHRKSENRGRPPPARELRPRRGRAERRYVKKAVGGR